MTQPTEHSWTIDGLELAGLAWGPEHGQPVLALHGWMDHAVSFAALAPQLTGCRVVAIDLSGHGLSAHRAAHATYNIWDDLPQIDALRDALDWDSCVMMGHSRGANIATLYTAALPERVRALITIDGLAPEPTEADPVQTLRAFVQQTRVQLGRSPRRFADTDSYVARRVQQGNARPVAEALAERALRQTDIGAEMRSDGRLFASSAVKLTRPQIEAVLRAITCPVLNIWASDGINQRPALSSLAEYAEQVIADYQIARFTGDHHLHMDPDTATAIAQRIDSFLAGLPSAPRRR